MAPVVSVSPQNQTVVEGETSNIICKATGVPHPKLSWKFENGELPTDAVIRNTSNHSLLLLPKTAKSMEGWYQCIAKNEAGEESSNSTLHVLGLFCFVLFCFVFVFLAMSFVYNLDHVWRAFKNKRV